MKRQYLLHVLGRLTGFDTLQNFPQESIFESRHFILSSVTLRRFFNPVGSASQGMWEAGKVLHTRLLSLQIWNKKNKGTHNFALFFFGKVFGTLHRCLSKIQVESYLIYILHFLMRILSIYFIT